MRELIQRRGISQRKLADAIGVSFEGLKYQLKTNNCPLDVLDRIAVYFQVPPKVFFEVSGGSTVEEPRAKYPEDPAGDDRNSLYQEMVEKELAMLREMIEQKDRLIKDQKEVIKKLIKDEFATV